MYAFCDEESPSIPSDPERDVDDLSSDESDWDEFRFPGRWEFSQHTPILTALLTILGWTQLLGALVLFTCTDGNMGFTYPWKGQSYGKSFHLLLRLSLAAQLYAFQYGYSSILMPSAEARRRDSYQSLLGCIHSNLSTPRITDWKWVRFQYTLDLAGLDSIEESKGDIPLSVANPQSTYTFQAAHMDEERVRFALFVADPRQSGCLFHTYSRQHSVWSLSCIQLVISILLVSLAFTMDLVCAEGPSTVFFLSSLLGVIFLLIWVVFQNLAIFAFKEAGLFWRQGQLARAVRKDLLVGPTVQDMEKGQNQEDVRRASRKRFEDFIWEVLITGQETPFELKFKMERKFYPLLDLIRL